MMDNTVVLRAYFEELGIDPNATDLYLTLQLHGAQTISELSRNAGIERTNVYRLIEKLKTVHLVEIEKKYKQSIVHMAPVANLHIFFSKKEQELRSQQARLALIEDMFVQRDTLSSPATQIQVYRGTESVKQMLWNQTRVAGENLSILRENMQSRTDAAFFDRWVRRCNGRQIRCRSIISDEFIASQRSWYAKHANERLAHWESRYVPVGIFPITHSVVIYGNVVAYYNWKGSEVFGVEIYSQEIADSQRLFFEMLWGRSVSVDGLATKLSGQISKARKSSPDA